MSPVPADRPDSPGAALSAPLRALRPQSLRSRQLWAASLGLLAFLLITGYALDRAFVDVASQGQRDRLKAYAYAYAAAIEYDVTGTLIAPEVPDSRFNRPGSGLYAEVVMPKGRWYSASAMGPRLPAGTMLPPLREKFESSLPMTQIDGTRGGVYRYGLGMAWAPNADENSDIPYTIYVMEDAGNLPSQIRIYRRALWGYLGMGALLLLLLQTLIVRWNLRPIRRVVAELKRVQRGQSQRMSEAHPRELEPLTDSINALIESERQHLDRQRNTLADLAHSLKTPLAVLRTRLDSGTDEAELRAELDTQLRRMNDLVGYQLTRAAASGHKLFAAPLAVGKYAEDIVQGLEKIYASKGVLCEFDIDERARFHGEPGDLQELLGNLLENAFKWARSRVLLTASEGESAAGRRPGLVLVVEDDGPGIAEDNIAHVLQRGVRGDERVQGHGIGLAIVQDVVHDYHGTLHVTRSQELGGAQFEVRLPPGL